MHHSNQSAVTVDNRFAMIPHWLILSNISDGALRLYAVLMKYAEGGTLQAFPSRARLAADMRKSVKSVDRHLKELEALGAVRVQRRKKAGSHENRSSVYTLVTANPIPVSTEPPFPPQEVGTPVSPPRDTSVAQNYTHLTTPTFTSIAIDLASMHSSPSPTGDAHSATHEQLGIAKLAAKQLITQVVDIYDTEKQGGDASNLWEELTYEIESVTGLDVGDAISNKRWDDRLIEVIEGSLDKGPRYGAGKWLSQLSNWSEANNY